MGVSFSIPFLFTQQAQAATTITVNAQADTTADDGMCTLREAIIAANTDSASGVSAGECAGGSGTDTINFNIAGPADFVNGGQNGYTISPTTGLPVVTSRVIINGYSQPGTSTNTAVAPNPLNTRLLIEIDGSNAGATNALSLIDDSDNSEIYGLVLNSFSQGDGISMLADNIVIRGNFIGVNPAGNTAQPNVVGINTFNSDPNAAKNVIVGGLNPADRNLISGNTSGTTGTASYPGTGWVIQGNYLGVAADGLTPIANSTNGGSGIFSIDDCNDVIVGGSQSGAINVFGASLGHGIAPHNVNNLTIEGNYIGLGYDGTTVLGNVDVGSVGAGLAITNTSSATIKNNRIAGWKSEGIYIGTGNADIDIENNAIFNNTGEGMILQSPNMNVVDNEVTGNSLAGIILGSSDNSVSSNTVSNNAGHGISVSADSNIVASNEVFGNGQNGITVSATDNTITGNTVMNNTSFGMNIEASHTIVEDNQISNNHSFANVFVGTMGAPIEDITIRGNKIGTKADGTLDGSYTQNMGVLVNGNVSAVIIGGNSSNDGNIIAGNSGNGIGVAETTMIGFGSGTPSNIAILGNSVFANTPGSIMGIPIQGLGIDHYGATFDGSFVLQSTIGVGPTPNDSSDPDVGPNNYMNFPVLNSATQNNHQLSINLDLDAAGTTDSNGAYRVEFFASDVADPTGYGEGLVYLGSAQVVNGDGQTISITLQNNIDLAGKVLTATTTALNNATPSGFGATSEFSEALENIEVVVAPLEANNSIADVLPTTGSNQLDIALLASVLLIVGAGLLGAVHFTRRSRLL